MADIFDPRKYIRLFRRSPNLVTADMTNPDTGLAAPINDLIYYNTDTQEPEIIGLGESHPLLSKGQWDAVIDDAYTYEFSDTYPTIQAALNASNSTGHKPIVSIFVRSAGDTDPITIAATDAVQRIQGKDADTTALPVNVTCNKDDVTFEQLSIANVAVIADGGWRLLIAECKVTGSGSIELNTESFVRDSSFYNSSGVPLTITAVRPIVERSRFDAVGVNAIVLPVSSGTQDDVLLQRNTIFGSNLSGYCITSSGAGSLLRPVLNGNRIFSAINGGALLLLQEGLISNNVFHLSVYSSGALLSISSPAGVDIRTIVGANSFKGNLAADILFRCTSADADAAGLVLATNTFRIGTILGSQDAMWLGNDMAGCTINFQSKTGMVVIGGDMTGATLQNIPADIVFRNVKGQADRGSMPKISKSVIFSSPAATLAVEDWLPDQAVRVPASGKHGTWTPGTIYVRVGTAGTGTNTILFRTSTTLTGARTTRATVNLGTAQEASAAITWTPADGDYMWVEVSAVGGTPPQKGIAQIDLLEEIVS